jgi:surfactin synthase thioesterase subunit
MRLVAFPHAGGAATYWFPMSRALQPDIEVLSVQYPGRQDRRAEKPIDNLLVLAERIAEVLRPWLDGPTAFFGHSMGASLAYEVARILERRGETPPLVQLFASGRRAPARLRPESVHLRDDHGLVAEIRRLSGTDDGVLNDAELLRMVLPAIRSDYRAIETYRPPAGPVLGCPITAFTGDVDPQVSYEEALAWREHTTGAFDIQVFSGGHFYLADQQEAVLEEISGRLRVHI